MNNIIDILKEEAESVDYTAKGKISYFDTEKFVDLILKEAVTAILVSGKGTLNPGMIIEPLRVHFNLQSKFFMKPIEYE